MGFSIVYELKALASPPATSFRAYYRTIITRQNNLYPFALAAARRALKAQSNAAVESVKQGQPIDQTIEAITYHAVSDAITAIYVRTVPVFASISYQQAGGVKADSEQWEEKKGFFEQVLNSSWVRSAREYVYGVGSERIRKITETTRTKVRQFLDDSLSNGWDIAKTARELTAYTQAINKSRAVVIARTEILSSSNHGALIGAKSTGLKMDKVWLSTRDLRTRDSHRHVNGQRVDINGQFLVNGYRMDQPGDTSNGAPGSEVIRCRCTVIFQPKN